MANPEHVEIVKQGDQAIWEWQYENPNERFDLDEADLSDADLREADLSEASLIGANLLGANLLSANFSGANVRGANVRGAYLNATNFRGANLRDADLCNVVLQHAALSHTALSNANLSQSIVGSTSFAMSDLSNVRGLETVIHSDRSEVGVHTLKRSRGNIPESFLRGCGMSPWEIEMAKLYDPELSAHDVSELVSTSLFSARTEGPLFIGGVFISYSHADSGLPDKLYERLQEAGASVWLDRHDMVAGDMNRQVLRELRLRDVVVLILSEASVKSDWVEHELKQARKKEKDEGRDVLCPIAVDDSWKAKMDEPEWAHLSKKLVLDFSKWKTKAFNGEFDKLLKGMKINYEVRK